MLIPLLDKIDKKDSIMSQMKMGMEGIAETETTTNGRKMTQGFWQVSIGLEYSQFEPFNSCCKETQIT